jgi:hypothetical protein
MAHAPFDFNPARLVWSFQMANEELDHGQGTPGSATILRGDGCNALSDSTRISPNKLLDLPVAVQVPVKCSIDLSRN